MPDGMVIGELIIKYYADIADIRSKLTDANKINEEVAKSAKKTAREIAGVNSTVKNMAAGFQSAIQGLSSLGLLKIAKDIAYIAGRSDELQRVMYTVGKTAGYSRDSMDRYEQGIRKMGIATNEARQSMTKMVQANLNLKYSTDLARAAQDLAVISGQNSSDTFQRMITNIQQLDTLGMRYMGIVIDREAAESKLAGTLGISTDRLTKLQKTQAFMNSTLEEAKKLTGTYEEAMNSWTKTAKSTERYTQNLQIALGRGMQEPLLNFERLLQSSMDNMTNWNEGTLKATGISIGLASGLIGLASAFKLIKLALGTSAGPVMAWVAALTALTFIITDEGVKGFYNQTIKPIGEGIGDLVGDLQGIDGESTWAWLEQASPIAARVLQSFKNIWDLMENFRPTEMEKTLVLEKVGVRSDKERSEDLSKTISSKDVSAEIKKQELELKKLQKNKQEVEDAVWLGNTKITDKILLGGFHSIDAYKSAIDIQITKAIRAKEEANLKLKAVEKDEKRKAEREKIEKDYTDFSEKSGVQSEFLRIEKLKTQALQEEAYTEFIIQIQKRKTEALEKNNKQESIMWEETEVKARQAKNTSGEAFKDITENITKATQKLSSGQFDKLSKELETIKEKMLKTSNNKEALQNMVKLADDKHREILKLADTEINKLTQVGEDYIEKTISMEKISAEKKLNILDDYYKKILSGIDAIVGDESYKNELRLGLERRYSQDKLKIQEQSLQKQKELDKQAIDNAKNTWDSIQQIIKGKETKAGPASEGELYRAIDKFKGMSVYDVDSAKAKRDQLESVKAMAQSMPELSKSAKNWLNSMKDGVEDLEKGDLKAQQEQLVPLTTEAQKLQDIVSKTKLDLIPEGELERVRTFANEVNKLQGGSLNINSANNRLTLPTKPGFIDVPSAIKPAMTESSGADKDLTKSNFTINIDGKEITASPATTALAQDLADHIKKEIRSGQWA